MIRLAEAPFDPARELTAFGVDNAQIGGIGIFIGRVRDHATGPRLLSLTLEHYPGMTERKLAEIEAEARARWPLIDCLIIHRTGRMIVGDAIVMVATAAAHRSEALESCSFLIDWLKTQAPFWKLEETGAGENWVEAKASDDASADRWNDTKPI